MLKVYRLQSGKIGDWLCENRSWSADSKNYCVQDSDAATWHEMCHCKINSPASTTRAEGTSCCSCWWLDWTCYQQTKFPQEGQNWRLMVNLQLWSRKEGPVVPVEFTWASLPEGIMAKLQQDHNHVNCVFWLGKCCPSRVCPSRPNN